jgi:ribonuclease Z
MAARLFFRYLEPTYFAGLLDDPVLWVKVRPWGRALLFDCGQLHHLAKRALKSVAALFISHAHMDHFMGFDTFVRQVLVSPRTFDVFGPPGIADKIAHKLSAYDWNLNEHFWCTFRVHEVYCDRIRRWLFSGPRRFARLFDGEEVRDDGVVFANRWVRVEARRADHRIPVLVYRLNEQPAFALDSGRVIDEGFVPGPWIRHLKEQYDGELLGKVPLTVPRAGSSGQNQSLVVEDTRKLYERLGNRSTAPSIGYMTDIGFSAVNEVAVVGLLRDVTLLVGECAFLADHKEKARQSYHLCTVDMNHLLDKIRPGRYLPVHLSKSCSSRSHELYRELRPPEKTGLIRLPDRLLGRPLLPCEVPMGWK